MSIIEQAHAAAVARVAELERQNAVLVAALHDFREHVIKGAVVWKMGAGSHHHPIWLRVAEALDGTSDPIASSRRQALEEAANADDIRASGWSVAVHNDYRQNGETHTFWLVTHKGGRWLKGEGRTDAEALNAIRALMDKEPQG